MTIFFIVVGFLALYFLFTRGIWEGLLIIAAFELLKFLSGYLLWGLIILAVLLIANFIPCLFGKPTLVDKFNI